MRQHNLALVMGTVAAHGPISRAAVAGHTGLTRAAVSSLVDELLAGGLLTELGPAANGRVGRPGSALEVSERGPAGLGLEVGVEHLGACVTDLRGAVRVWIRVESANAALTPAEALTRLSALADDATQQAAALGLRPVAAIVAVPGLVGDVPGTVDHAPNLGWHDVPVAALWPGELPLRVENEANLGALAELWAHPVAADFVHVSAESGIGAALVVGGRLFSGARGLAGELGHMPVHPEGHPCSCGARGCLEQYAGKSAVLRMAGVPAENGTGSAAAGTPAAGGASGAVEAVAGRGGVEGVNGLGVASGAGAAGFGQRGVSGGRRDVIEMLAVRAGEGDARVLDALDQAGTALGTALAGAVNLLDPAAVVLGGAYAELGTWLLPSMRRELAERVTVRSWDSGALTVSELGRRGPLLGAALVTVRAIVEDPAALWS
ncbi:ROK family protein [Nonomuraea glycinis]|uniref:Xylose repressor n=1 Tax=Nonomuraea glycinis TaxID=2047744 RepID=A0A918E789_9ACTN|nr:ROK family transcriptional regulator [Nonomuraea glycinis]MCA2177271.1 ROK family protein [Nonomuraea glycinis]GGP08967.1 xylose repressor [Nonomuraea glycinis]